jgi:hypothetical protein
VIFTNSCRDWFFLFRLRGCFAGAEYAECFIFYLTCVTSGGAAFSDGLVLGGTVRAHMLHSIF